MFSPRGRGLIIGGIFLISLGLSLAGVGTLKTMIPIFFGEQDEGLFGQLAGSEDIMGGTDGETTNQTDYLTLILQFFDVPATIVEYSMFLGTIMLLAVIIGLPTFRLKSNATVIRISRKIDREKAFAGEFVHVSINVTNTSRTRLDFVEIYDGIPETFELAMGENFIITQLGGKDTKEFSYVIRTTTRGVYKIGPTKVIIHGRIGFYYEEDTREYFTEILTYPSYQDIRRMDALNKKRQIGKQFGSHKTKEKGTGDDFHSLRKYYPGDEFKKLDWKAFSRTGELMVREFEMEKNIRMVIFLDHSASMGGGVPNNTKLDFAIRSVMLLMHMAEEAQDVAGLVTFSDFPTSYLAPSGKKGLFFQMLEILALVEPKGSSNPLEAVDYVMQRLPRSSFYIFITDLESSNVGDFLEAAKRAISAKNKIAILSPLGPLFESVMDLSEVEKAIAEAIMEEFILHRKTVEQALRGLDLDIINVGPDDMLAEVIRAYHEGKNKGFGVM
ncbi:MAG: DUF58 domain-containing protein [Candidatus Hodarchaeales archaeon]|jgi:uncharacterized protein (DUF58 family)